MRIFMCVCFNTFKPLHNAHRGLRIQGDETQICKKQKKKLKD